MLFNLLTTLLFTHLSLVSAATLPNPPSPLHWSVFNAAPIPVISPPQNFTFSPTAFTLIHGLSTAILVDAPLNTATASSLADWIDSTIPGKKLTHIYITHGHGDHFFGLPVLQLRFPGVVPVATEKTIEHIAQQLTTEEFVDFWGVAFPDQIPVQNETIQKLPANGELWLEGHVLKAVEVGQSDTYNTTVLHVPDLDLVVAGDAVYGECYQYFVETNTTALRKEWMKAIDEIEKLEPKIVVPSHKQVWDGFGPDHLEKTRQYIRDWERLAGVASSAEELHERIVELYPKRVGDWILSISVEEVFATDSGVVAARNLFPMPVM